MKYCKRNNVRQNLQQNYNTHWFHRSSLVCIAAQNCDKSLAQDHNAVPSWGLLEKSGDEHNLSCPPSGREAYHDLLLLLLHKIQCLLYNMNGCNTCFITCVRYHNCGSKTSRDFSSRVVSLFSNHNKKHLHILQFTEIPVSLVQVQ